MASSPTITTPSLEDLPIELLVEIVNFTPSRKPTGQREGKEDLCKLRLVSRRLNALVSPVLFASLNLQWENVDHDNRSADALRCQEIVIALTTGSTRVFEHTTKLDFFPHRLYWALDDEEGIVGMRKVLEENLFSAISALKKLRDVSWYYDPDRAPEPLSTDFIRALSTLQSFEGFRELRLKDDPRPSFSLKPISDLRFFRTFWGWDESKHYTAEVASLLTRCPNLTDISFGGGPSGTGKDARLRDLFAELNKLDQPLPLTKFRLHGVLITSDHFKDNLHHFRQLKSLRITRNPGWSPSTFGEICSILKQNDIFLTGVCTDTVHHPLLFDYLVSYSGLQKLRLEGEHILDDSPELVDEVLQTVLPKHKNTLQNLALGATRANAWSALLTDSQMTRIAECQKLRKLEIHYLSPDYTEESITLAITRYLELGMKLPELRHLRVYTMGQGVGVSPRDKIRLMGMARRVMDGFKEERRPKFRINNK